MKKEEFIELIGQDVVVEYPFCGEIQLWSMKNFYVDQNGKIFHNRIRTLNTDIFISNARKPHEGKATHG